MRDTGVRQRDRRGEKPARDWRLAAFGSGCCSLGIACLMLVACSAAPQRRPVVAAVPSVADASQPISSNPMPLPAVMPAVADVVAPASPWPRLRKRLAMPGCDYNPAVRRWSHTFTQSPVQFAASMSEAMPYLLVVLDQIERRDLPGEFAFLPFIESTYTPITSSGDRAAGIWQLMPDTARERGLKITPEYDGRVDIYASTNAALDLIERYQREFDDWRVVDLAYNAGEYGLKTLVGSPTASRSADEISRLRVNPGAHDHLAKLLAVACVASDPERFHVELPEPSTDDVLAHIELAAPVDLNLIAWISRTDLSMLKRYNAGYTTGRMPTNGPYGLLVPALQRTPIEDALALLPKPMWRDWHEIALQQDESVDVLATAHDLNAHAVASINHVAADGVLPAGKRILIPGRDPSFVAETAPVAAQPSARSAQAIHLVSRGETIWSIARTQHVRPDDLQRWNNLSRTATLHLGQRLRLTAPNAGTSTSTVAGGAN